MNTTLLIPLVGGFGPHADRWGDGPPPFVPFLGVIVCILFLLVLFGAFFLVRKGMSGGARPPWVPRPDAPEDEAKRVLSERFARGDISTDEFLERASVLNWTPGTETPWDQEKGKKKR